MAKRKRVLTKWHKYQTRRWAKPVQSSGSGPNPIAMTEYKQRTLSLRDPGSTVPDTIRRDVRAVVATGYRNFNIDPRLEIEIKIEEERRKSCPWWEEWRHIVLRKLAYETILLYWSGNTFRFIKEDHVLDRTYQSQFDYFDRASAMHRYKNNIIKWVHRQPISVKAP